MPKNLFDVSKVYSAYLVDNSIVFNNLTGATYLPTLKTLAPALKVGDIIYVYADITNGREYFNLQGKNHNFGSPVEITDLKSQLIFYANGGITKYSNVIFSLTPDSTYDEFKQSQPFTLTSPVPLTKWDKLIKRDGVWGWSIWSKEYNRTVDGLQLWTNIGTKTYIRLYVRNILAIKGSECRCDLLQYGKEEAFLYCGFWYNTNFQFLIHASMIEPYGYVYDETLTNNQNGNNAATAFKALLKDKGYDTFHVWADMQEEQAFIPLPDEEQTLLNNLETYYGVTNVYNEQGCPMWLTYVTDTKLYVDQKLLEIQQAII